MQADKIPKAVIPRKKRLRWILWVISGLVLVLILGIGLAVFLIPYTASRPWFREIVESYASRSLKRSVSIESMTFGWEKGLRMESIRIMDDPLFSGTPLGSIGTLEAVVDFPDLFKNRRFTSRIFLDAVTLFIVKEKDGGTNLQRLIADLTSPDTPEASAPDGKDGAFVLFFSDFAGKFRFRDLNILYEDRVQQQTAGLHDASLDIEIPSLFKKPLLFKAAAQVRSRDRPLPPVNVFLRIKDLFDESKTVRLHRAAIDAKVSAPGVQIDLEGNLSQRKASGKWRVDLETILPVVRAFLPETSLPLRNTGRFELAATITQLDDTSAVFDTTVLLKDLEIQRSSGGKPLPGPITLTFNQRGTMDFSGGDLFIESGAFSLNSSRVNWKGRLTGLAGPDPRMRLAVGPSVLYFSELLSPGAPFLPEPFPLKFPESSGNVIKMEKMDISGRPLQGLFFVEISGLSGSIERFGIFLRPETPFAQADRLEVSFPQIRCALSDLAPTEFFARGSAIITNLSLYEEKEIHIDSLDLSEFQLNTKALRQEKGAPFGFTLPFSFSASLEAAGIRALDLKPAEFTLSGLTIQGDLGTETFATAAVDVMHLYIPGFNHHDPALGRVNGDVFIKIRVPHLRIKSLNPLQGDVKGFTGRLLVDKGIEGILKADALDLGRQGFTADASLTADLGRLGAVLPDLFRDLPRLAGNARAECRLTGRIPASGVFSPLRVASFFDPESPLMDSARLALDLSGVGGSWPLSSESALTVESIATPKPLVYVFDGKHASGALTGEIQVKAIPPFAFPFQDSAGPPSSVAFHLAVTGEHDRLTAASFSTTLSIQPLGAWGEASFSVEGLDAAFKSSASWDPMTWLQHITGIARITGTLPENSKIVPAPETTLQGGVKIEAELETAPEKGMHIRMKADTKDLDVEKTGIFSIQNLETALTFEKQYRVSRQDLRGKEKTGHLSETVIRDRVEGQRGVSEPGILAGRDARLQARLSPAPSISFGPALFTLSPRVLPVRHCAMDLSFVEGLPLLRHLEIHFLGGALLGTAGVFRKNDHLTLDAQLVFSDIDLKQILGGHETAMKEEDASIAGQLEIDFPLVLSMPRLLESLQLSLQFNHIGSRAFGRMLYLLDPYESNETIVSQRRLLRSGVPRWIDIHVQNGILSLDGEVIVKGIPIKIPHLERLNLAAISGLKAYEGYLTALGDLNRILDLTSDPDLFLEWIKP
ncbi:MAG: hypothetical protein JRI76_10000 [Deltaproteobacteria bacterium]|nr:hypothetical protein [Deltaproteobacteria bacterium]